MERQAKRSSFAPKLIVELTESGIKLRLFFMILFLAVASYAFYAVFTKVLHTEPGWNTVTVQKPATTASQEFDFTYHFGVSGVSASAEWSALHKKYNILLDGTYKAFSIEPFEGVNNLHALSAQPNTAVTLEKELYAALELLESHGSRYLFYAPVYEIHRGLAHCTNDWEAESFDPARNEELAAYLNELLSFVSSPEHIRVELLGDDTARLAVSAEYLAFAKENEISNLLDFYYWKNAFVLDALADRLIADGYTAGVITTAEGYCRALGAGEYAISIPQTQGDLALNDRALTYEGPQSVLSLCTSPVKGPAWFYIREDGTFSGPFIDLQTGLSIQEEKSLTVLSLDHGCGELLLLTWNDFLSGTVDTAALNTLGIFTA